ncbi:MAG TPA: cation diffusion facilitator family transporter [Sedimentisphaerales bacterium]|nr:cation diffusion facilitator family transporter [Sedimentisphaerales bacterium]
MQNDKFTEAGNRIKYVTNISIVTNILLACLKFVVGVLAGSIALVADGIHSFSDIATDVVVLVGVRIGARLPDEKHHYGHGRAETFSGGLIALVLLFVGAGMIYYAGNDITKGSVTAFHPVVLVIAAISIFAKEWLYRITKRVAVKDHSAALYANAWHHRSDAGSSVAVLIGYALLPLGFNYGDQLAAVAVGLMIVLVSVRVVADFLHELTEAAVDTDTIEQIKKIVNADTSVRRWHKLRTRTLGREVFLDLHILVDPELNIEAAHQIAENLENAMHAEIPRPVNITVHIEPDTPAMGQQA